MTAMNPSLELYESSYFLENQTASSNWGDIDTLTRGFFSLCTYTLKPAHSTAAIALGLNAARVQSDLNAHPMVVAEAIQNILRREQFPEPYEALKSLTRGKHSIQMADIHHFIDDLGISEELKAELKKITPENYTGVYPEFDGR